MEAWLSQGTRVGRPRARSRGVWGGQVIWYNMVQPSVQKTCWKTDGFLHPLGICRMRLHRANPFKEVGDQLSGYSQGVDQYTCMR